MLFLRKKSKVLLIKQQVKKKLGLFQIRLNLRCVVTYVRLAGLDILNSEMCQSCKSGRAFQVGLGFGPGSGLTFIKTSGLFRVRYDAYK